MHTDSEIVDAVYRAKTDSFAADQLIQNYLPFIGSEASKVVKHPVDQNDDEFSIAMIAFHEAVGSYSKVRGPFLRYAAMVIRSRLLDYHRKERKHRLPLSLELSKTDDGPSPLELPDPQNRHEQYEIRDATRWEIEELIKQLSLFGVSLSDVAENCPKQSRTLAACKKVLTCAKEIPGLLDEFLKTKRLPISLLSEQSGVEKKTLERHRKYLVALLLIHANGYEIIRGHLAQIGKGGKSA